MNQYNKILGNFVEVQADKTFLPSTMNDRFGLYQTKDDYEELLSQ